MTKTVAILGCGPAGLLAAHAADRAGWTPHIFSQKQKSSMAGAMYVHNEIPGLTMSDDQDIVHFTKIGTKEGYATKVYGSPKARCSWDKFPEGSLPCWSMQLLYDRLWMNYESEIKDVIIDPFSVEGYVDSYHKVFCTIPARALCLQREAHKFGFTNIWVNVSQNRDPVNEITYNGDPFAEWYRASQLFGWTSLEYGQEVENAYKGTKPLWTNCNCHGPVKRLGRFGRWERGILVTDAYKEAVGALL